MIMVRDLDKKEEIRSPLDINEIYAMSLVFLLDDLRGVESEKLNEKMERVRGC